MDLRGRFWDKVGRGQPDECWEWLAGKNHAGYGIYRAGKHKYRAHRYAYEAVNHLRLDASDCVCHSCDNPSCVNPAHLFVGTHDDNMQDMIEKGRSPARERNGRATLSEAQVKEIRARRKAGETFVQIASDMPVSVPTVRRAAIGESWK